MRGSAELEQRAPQHPDLGYLLTPSRAVSRDGAQLLDWNSILRPYLEDALKYHGSYTTQDIQQHLRFFTEYVARWLGPGPSYHPETGLPAAQFPSSLTNDHTPFEVSCCWKSKKQNGKAIVRYVTDVVPSGMEVSRMAAFQQALTVINVLGQVASPTKEQPREAPFSLRAFSELWTRITQVMIENEQQTHSMPCSRCARSAAFVGFDLVDSVAFAKLYWLFPVCQTSPTLLASAKKTLQACVDVDPINFSRILDSWGKIATYIEANSTIIQPRILSIDATKFPVPRVKIYARRTFSNTNKFSDIEPHLSLGGLVPLAETFRRTCEALWTSLVGPEDSQPGKGPKFCLLLYELPTGAPGEAASKEVSAKLYVMCQEIPRIDSFLARRLQEHCPVLQDAELIREFEQCSDPTAFICEVGLAPRGSEAEVSIYCSPCWSSRATWKDCVESDGRLRKVRRVLPQN